MHHYIVPQIPLFKFQITSYGHIVGFIECVAMKLEACPNIPITHPLTR